MIEAGKRKEAKIIQNNRLVSVEKDVGEWILCVQKKTNSREHWFKGINCISNLKR